MEAPCLVTATDMSSYVLQRAIRIIGRYEKQYNKLDSGQRTLGLVCTVLTKDAGVKGYRLIEECCNRVGFHFILPL